MDKIFKTLVHFIATGEGFFAKPEDTVKEIWRDYTLIHRDCSYDKMKKAIKKLEKEGFVYVDEQNRLGLTPYGIAKGLEKYGSPILWHMFENQTKRIEEKKV